MALRRRAGTVPVVGALIAAAFLAVPQDGSAAPPSLGIETVPAGMTTIVENGAWSWFDDERARLSTDGSTLFTSAVTGRAAPGVGAGAVVLTELDLASGDRRLVDLGGSEVDDHNNASIWAAADGEITTSWTRHHRDQLIQTQRRRTDGSWLRLPAIGVASTASYSNLLSGTGETGADVLYDFYRGDRFDPSALVSEDVGRTWTRLGRVLRDPDDAVTARPYVVYADDGQGRINLIATEAHPRDERTSIYHGYIERGRVFKSNGVLLGPVGSAIPVTALTLVWEPAGDERAWVSGIEHDPANGQPVITFSVRQSIDDHRYWYGRWDGTSWQTAEVAFAGRALYSAEVDYTGLPTVDPTDPNHLVISTDAHPVTGLPLVSTTDGARHWELWDGRRSPGGAWTWTARTANSATDNLRPTMTAGGGAQALLWMRGRYSAYSDYDTDIVGIVRSTTNGIVAARPAQLVATIDVVPSPAPTAEPGHPVVGSFDGHPADDLFVARAGSTPEALLLGDAQRHPTAIAAPSVVGSYTPIAGDYDGNGTTDIYWYAPGPGLDSLWLSSSPGRFTKAPTPQVASAYTPIPGDYDGNGTTDIYWYAPGSATDWLWTAFAGSFTPVRPRQVQGTYVPIGGDHDRDGYADILWYAAGSSPETRWTGGPGAVFTVRATRQVQGTYAPVSGDFDGNGHDDVLWYVPGAAVDRLWMASGSGVFADAGVRSIVRQYVPVTGDFDGDGRDDVHWYAPGTATDRLWWSASGPLASDEVATVNL